MYNPNSPNKINPPPPAHDYGTATNYTNFYNQGHSPNVNQGNIQQPAHYDLPYMSKNPYNYEEPPTGVTGNGGLFDEHTINEFSSKKIRHGFIRKVYLLLTLQLLFTFGFTSYMVFNDKVKIFVLAFAPVISIMSLLLVFPILISIACYPSLGKKYPLNYILLFLVTIGMTGTVMICSATVKTEAFMFAFGITAVVTSGLTLFSFQTKYDFTGWGVYLFVGFLILFILGILGIFMPGKIFTLLYAGLGTLLISFAIIVDTQLIVGGKHRKYEYSIDDYIFATLTLYIDIINLFLMVLSLVSNSSD